MPQPTQHLLFASRQYRLEMRKRKMRSGTGSAWGESDVPRSSLCFGGCEWPRRSPLGPTPSGQPHSTVKIHNMFQHSDRYMLHRKEPLRTYWSFDQMLEYKGC